MATPPFSARRTEQSELLMIDVLGVAGKALERQAVQQGCFHLGGSIVLHMRKHVRVGIQGECGARMSELLGHYFRRDSNRQSKSGKCVAEIVQPDVRQTSFSQDWFEMLLNQVFLDDRFATRGGKDQIGKYRGARRPGLISPAFQLPE